MSEDKETRQKLLESAKTEFIAKGYMQASLRTICKNAGVTTGALYFFFNGKEDLFDEIVKVPVEKIMEVAKNHYQVELGIESIRRVQHDDYSDDMDSAAAVIHCMYQYYDEVLLVLTKAQGSKYENIVDTFVDVTQSHYRVLMDKMCEMNGSKSIDDYIIHWLSHMQIDVFVHLITHETDEKKAMKYMQEIFKYLLAGWNGMFQ